MNALVCSGSLLSELVAGEIEDLEALGVILLLEFLQEQKGFAGWDMNHPIAPILDDMLSKEDPDYKQKPTIKWNFTKFLINKKGQVVARFEPTESIENIAKQIEELLK